MENAPKGYKFIEDESNGEVYAVNDATGETVETMCARIILGSDVLTPEDKRKMLERKKQIKKFCMQRAHDRSLGRYVFVNINQDFSDISPDALARLFYLALHLGYGDDIVMKTQRTKLILRELPMFMRISESTSRRFWEEICPKYAHEDEDGGIHINSSAFRLGKLGKGSSGYQKVHKDAFKSLYRKMPASKHRYLGYVLKMLPYINIEYNVLCENIFDTDIEDMYPLSVKAFCKRLGYNYSAASRLIKEYEKLKISVEGHEEPLCSFTGSGHKKMIFVNPHVIYSGTNYEKVEVMGNFRKKRPT